MARLEPSMTLLVQDPPRATKPPERRIPVRGVALPGSTEPGWLTPAAVCAALVLHVVLIAVLNIRVQYGEPHAYSDVIGVELYPLGPSAPEHVAMSEPASVPVGFDPPAGSGEEPPAPITEPRPMPITPRSGRPERPAAEVPPTAVTNPGVAGGTEVAGVPTGVRDPGGNAYDRVRPRGTDARLWGPVPSLPAEKTVDPDPFGTAIAPLYMAMGVYNDSMAAAAAAAAKATDWTHTDANGGRWGISPEGLHLGSLTLPIPLGFAPPPGRRDELSGRVNSWNAIQRQGQDVAARESFEDRVKAIRARKAAERDSARATKKNE